MIIFTDLDGSLLDYSDYSYHAALPALEMILSGNIPLIMCTSKTRKEVESLQNEMGITEPFIVENGAGIYFPQKYHRFRIEKGTAVDNLRCVTLGMPYSSIRNFIEQVCREFSVRGFGDMGVEEIAERTGLPHHKAAMAKAREFTEPFIIESEDLLPDLEKAARAAGIKVAQGGLFSCFIGVGHDKGEAVKQIKTVFEKNQGYRDVTVGIGDSLNDLPMLSQVDIPILIPHPDRREEDVSLPDLIRATLPGSRGWNQVIYALLSELEKYA